MRQKAPQKHLQNQLIIGYMLEQNARLHKDIPKTNGAPWTTS